MDSTAIEQWMDNAGTAQERALAVELLQASGLVARIMQQVAVSVIGRQRQAMASDTVSLQVSLHAHQGEVNAAIRRTMQAEKEVRAKAQAERCYAEWMADESGLSFADWMEGRALA